MPCALAWPLSPELHRGASSGRPCVLSFWGDLLLDFFLPLCLIPFRGWGWVCGASAHGPDYWMDLDAQAVSEKLAPLPSMLPLLRWDVGCPRASQLLGLSRRGAGTGRQNQHTSELHFYQDAVLVCLAHAFPSYGASEDSHPRSEPIFAGRVRGGEKPQGR